MRPAGAVSRPRLAARLPARAVRHRDLPQPGDLDGLVQRGHCHTVQHHARCAEAALDHGAAADADPVPAGVRHGGHLPVFGQGVRTVLPNHAVAVAGAVRGIGVCHADAVETAPAKTIAPGQGPRGAAGGGRGLGKGHHGALQGAPAGKHRAARAGAGGPGRRGGGNRRRAGGGEPRRRRPIYMPGVDRRGLHRRVG